MKQIFEPITLDDLYKLALNDPTVHAGLTMYRIGHMTLEQALIATIAALAYEKQALQKELESCLSTKSVVFQLDAAPPTVGKVSE